MLRNLPLPAIVIIALLLTSCSKKHQPQSTIRVTNYPSNTDTAAMVNKPVERKVVKRVVPKTAVPKVITVDDRAAHTTAEGRKYYDLEGRRYWRNFSDGKYYLFHKDMFDDPAFKPH